MADLKITHSKIRFKVLWRQENGMFDTKLPFRPLFNSKDVGSEASAEVEDQRRNKLFEGERKEVRKRINKGMERKKKKEGVL